MVQENWLICGTRKKIGYRELVHKELERVMWNERAIYRNWKPSKIIEGCCPDSADVWAEEWAIANDVFIDHHPSMTMDGTYEGSFQTRLTRSEKN